MVLLGYACILCLVVPLTGFLGALWAVRRWGWNRIWQVPPRSDTAAT